VARQVIAGGEVPEFVDAGSQAVTAGNVAEFPREGLFAEFAPKVLD
jgi:ribose transport system substrate-binding protein